VLATGGLLGGGITISNNDYAQEMILGLPVSFPGSRSCWFNREFFSPESHPVFQGGININHSFQPIATNGDPVYDNLYAIGNLLANCDPVRERSLEGVALASGYKVAKLISRSGSL
jgi:glycerol-3-phosphate dehydrogenase subunit B